MSQRIFIFRQWTPRRWLQRAQTSANSGWCIKLPGRGCLMVLPKPFIKGWLPHKAQP